MARTLYCEVCMDHRHVTAILRHLTRPTRGGAAAVLIIFALLLFIAAQARIAGIPLAVILISWFFKYAYILFDHTWRGFDEPPTLDIQMLNPLDEQRPLAQVLILGLIYLAVKFASDTIGSTAAIILAVVLALLLPASVAVLGLEGNILKAAYPVAWVRLVWKLGPVYLLVLAVIGGYTLLIVLLGRWELWLPLQIAIFMFCTLSVFSVLGGALYERRHELGLETYHSPERTEERLQAQKATPKRARADRSLRKNARRLAHRRVAAAANLVDGARQLPGELSLRFLRARRILGRSCAHVTRLTEDYVDRLLTLKRTGDALTVVAQRLREDPSFRPKSASATLQIARLAAAGGGTTGVARALLADFSTRFAGDPSVVAADALSRHLIP